MLDNLLDLTGTTTPEFQIAAPLLNHIETLHGGLPGWTEVSCIHPDPAHKPKMVSLWARCTDTQTMAENALRAAKANLQGYGLYIGITTRKAEKTSHERGKIEDAQNITCLWADLDADKGATLDDLTAFNPPASIILYTGGGVHAYWMLAQAEEPTEAHKYAMKGIAKALHGDKVYEFARVMRALGSYNTKPGRDNARCVILRWEPGMRYQLRDFAHLIDIEPSKPIRSVEPAQYDAAVPEWIQEYLDHPPAQGLRNSTLFRVAGGLHDRSWTEQDALSRLFGFAGLDDREVEQVVHSAFERPIRGAFVHGRDGMRTAARG